MSKTLPRVEGKTISDLNEEKRNHKAKHSDFPVGTAVKIVCACRDFHFWYGETGIVTENKGGGSYLGIRVKLDEPRVYDRDDLGPGWTMETFNFNPEDLRRRAPKKSFLNKVLILIRRTKTSRRKAK